MYTNRTVALSAALTVFGVATSTIAHAQVQQLTSAGQLMTADVVANFPNGPAPAGFNMPSSPVPVASPYNVSVAGNTLVFTDPNADPNGNGFQVDTTDVGFANENPDTSGNIFPSGTLLLDNAVNTDSTTYFNGPDTINFTQPVSEFGLQAYDEQDEQNFAFTVNLDNGTSSTYTILNDPDALTSSGAAAPDFTPVFIGARGIGDDIASVNISDLSYNTYEPGVSSGFVITAVTLPTPELASPIVFGCGIAGLAVLACRRRRATITEA